MDDGAIRGSESANGVGVLAASGNASEGGGGVFGEGGDDLTEEERETVSHVLVIVHTITNESLDACYIIRIILSTYM